MCVCCLGVVHTPVQSTRRTLPPFRMHQSSHWVAQYMLLRCGGTWERAGLEVAEEDLSQWYWEVIKPKSPYVIREGDDTRGKKRALAKGKGMVSSDEEEVEEPVVSGGGREGTGKKKNGAGHPALAKGKGRAVGGRGDEGPAGGDMECNHTLLKMRILAFLPINPCSNT